ncbi:MAG: hypothetical protein IJG33_16830 [Selenomonadaceae bacterium]|nr:hypothetical protein [Selenomonadaceae bacterium]
MTQVRVRKRGKTFSYIFEAGKVDGQRKVVEKSAYPKLKLILYLIIYLGEFNECV